MLAAYFHPGILKLIVALPTFALAVGLFFGACLATAALRELIKLYA